MNKKKNKCKQQDDKTNKFLTTRQLMLKKEKNVTRHDKRTTNEVMKTTKNKLSEIKELK